MRKRLIVALLMMFLSFTPAYAGHSVVGYGWCECDDPASHTQSNSSSQQDSTSELGLLVLLLTALTLSNKG